MLKQPWMDQKKCSPEQLSMFYSFEIEVIEEARRFCQDCPVIEECFQFAIFHNEDGVWGGTSERQRRKLLRRAYVSGLPVTSLPRSRPRELSHPVNACSFDLSGISFQRNRTPEVSKPRFASLRVQFHIASRAS